MGRDGPSGQQFERHWPLILQSRLYMACVVLADLIAAQSRRVPLRVRSSTFSGNHRVCPCVRGRRGTLESHTVS